MVTVLLFIGSGAVGLGFGFGVSLFDFAEFSLVG